MRSLMGQVAGFDIAADFAAPVAPPAAFGGGTIPAAPAPSVLSSDFAGAGSLAATATGGGIGGDTHTHNYDGAAPEGRLGSTGGRSAIGSRTVVGW